MFVFVPTSRGTVQRLRVAAVSNRAIQIMGKNKKPENNKIVSQSKQTDRSDHTSSSAAAPLAAEAPSSKQKKKEKELSSTNPLNAWAVWLLVMLLALAYVAIVPPPGAVTLAIAPTRSASGSVVEPPRVSFEDAHAGGAKLRQQSTSSRSTPPPSPKPVPKPVPTPMVIATPPDCKDEEDQRDCEYWSSQGECSKNPTFMLEKCKKSCNACNAPKKVDRCAWDPSPDAPMGVPPGGMASIRAKALSLPLLEPSVLSEDPLILQFDNFIQPSEADAIMAAGAKMGYQPSEVLDKGHGDWKRSMHRTSSSTHCHASQPCWKVMEPLLTRAFPIVGMGERHAEVQLLEYAEGQYYKSHSDFLGGSENFMAGPRALTLLMYLDDPPEGGETAFPEIGLTVQAKRGRAILWPSALDQNPRVKDTRTKHQALPVLRGGKHAVNIWYYQRDFWEASSKGCMG